MIPQCHLQIIIKELLNLGILLQSIINVISANSTSSTAPSKSIAWAQFGQFAQSQVPLLRLPTASTGSIAALPIPSIKKTDADKEKYDGCTPEILFITWGYFTSICC